MTSVHPQSGLIIEVPEAETVVGPHRAELDANAALGVPAHVTILFPFVPPDRIDGGVLERLAELLSGARAFDYAFARTAWFDDDVLWLAPDDPAPFRDLTHRVHRAWPEHPPFEGAFVDVVPHLTVGHGVDLERLREAERAMLPLLPVGGRAERVSLFVDDEDGMWVRTASFPLLAP